MHGIMQTLSDKIGRGPVKVLVDGNQVVVIVDDQVAGLAVITVKGSHGTRMVAMSEYHAASRSFRIDVMKSPGV